MSEYEQFGDAVARSGPQASDAADPVVHSPDIPFVPPSYDVEGEPIEEGETIVYLHKLEDGSLQPYIYVAGPGGSIPEDPAQE
ncbi:hypothetical protein BH23ACT12_BH23ACT12_17480 [soil metagenome]